MKRSSALKLIAERGSLVFGTKGETLERLGNVLTTAQVLPQIRFTSEDWQRDPKAILKHLATQTWGKGKVAIRSSASSEDAATASLAGHFDTVLNVSGDETIRLAIDQVIASYGKITRPEQVFIQPMALSVVMSGVAFSADPSTGSPYLVLNYDDATGSTSSVTEGSSNSLRTYYYFPHRDVMPPSPLDKVVALVFELKTLFAMESLDVEFAVDRAGNVTLFQVRPLVMPLAQSEATEGNVRQALEKIEKKFRMLNQPHPYLFGVHTVLGVMPDWNPAEIVGIRPRPLALSLYKELVTDSIWAYQRDNYGYRSLRSFPLLINLCGLPYIDVRVSFNSFIPSDIDPILGEKLLNYYIEKLIASPTDHDKVEFAVVNTCYTLDLDSRLGSLRRAGFSEAECNKLTDSLRNLTNRIINGEQGLWRKDIEKIKKLELRLDTISNSRLDKVSKIYWMLEDCKRYGTLPFAGLARAGFIAVQMLQSLLNVGVFAKAEYDNFMASLETVSSRMKRDLREMTRPQFLSRYGHLRPGTYDILSPRYDEDPDRYFDWDNRAVGEETPSMPFALSLPQLKKIEKLLTEHRLEHDVLGFFDFIKAAIEGRELAKFVFTRSLSDSLTLFKSLAAENGFSVEECSYADVSCIKTLYASSSDARSILEQSIEEGERAYSLTKRLTLPPLIVDPKDIWAFELPGSEPNYITQKAVTASIVDVGAPPHEFKGKILFIPSADPGYDWIFSHGIAGLVTMYGGANSHMAIRAGELSIPSVIGAGEKWYRHWTQAKTLSIDCNNRQVKIIK